MNSVHIIGNIARDVELKYAQSGTAIANFGVAVNKKVKNAASGRYEDKPVFIDITAFGKTAETLNQYFRKGSKIGIDGELNFEQWTAQDGQKKSKLSVIMNRLHFIDKKDDSQQGGQAPKQNYGQQQQGQQYQPQGQQYGQPQQQTPQNSQAQQNSQAPTQAGQPQYNQPQQGQNTYQQPQQPQGQYNPQAHQQAPQQQAYGQARQAQNPQVQGQPNPNGPQQGQLPQNNGQQAQQPISEDQIPF